VKVLADMSHSEKGRGIGPLGYAEGKKRGKKEKEEPARG